ncbi:MAG: alcohol dehydrogenase catalytic domain-containing protein, partial [Nitrosopumilaceae archaeon]|nr:alcohol dehydrogenase catalytic domain-containing protein [Nitrosopumilaceae archaeon]
MKALVYDEYTTDDDFSKILKIKDIPEPKPKPNDIWGMRGKPLAIPLPHISGTDAAGEVIAIGDDVKNIKVGDRVVSHGNMSCRVCKTCTKGEEYNCKKRKIWGFETGPLWGGYCEVTHLPEVN